MPRGGGLGDGRVEEEEGDDFFFPGSRRAVADARSFATRHRTLLRTPATRPTPPSASQPHCLRCHSSALCQAPPLSPRAAVNPSRLSPDRCLPRSLRLARLAELSKNPATVEHLQDAAGASASSVVGSLPRWRTAPPLHWCKAGATLACIALSSSSGPRHCPAPCPSSPLSVPLPSSQWLLTWLLPLRCSTPVGKQGAGQATGHGFLMRPMTSEQSSGPRS